ncbi:hypothetical protein EVAR_9371_1 [Eumeta japonica]|uniref:Uncharacterized protein n=1 Tax=Eumeta variegata TaxID=151549 RepID=A0A4C1YTQ9_EUMVA|nr:hypothetical protein EVAR_9371_1 [Eumeta japonica]
MTYHFCIAPFQRPSHNVFVPDLGDFLQAVSIITPGHSPRPAEAYVLNFVRATSGAGRRRARRRIELERERATATTRKMKRSSDLKIECEETETADADPPLTVIVTHRRNDFMISRSYGVAQACRYVARPGRAPGARRPASGPAVDVGRCDLSFLLLKFYNRSAAGGARAALASPYSNELR